MRKKTRKKLVVLAILTLLIGVGFFLILSPKKFFEVESRSLTGAPEEEAFSISNQASPISGKGCPDWERRPIAIMLSGDAVTRPLSGLAEADLIFEMPVLTGGITRLMAVYVCGNPAEIGSVRSSRDDFIPLALGLGAIYAHWGGSHFALAELRAGIADNIDALTNPYDAYYRKSGIVAPHNGFTSIKRLVEAARKLGFNLKNNFSGYPHFSPGEIKSENISKKLFIDYAEGCDVEYSYEPAGNSYWRSRGGIKETDRNSGKQIEAKNIVIMRTESRQLDEQYNDVRVNGEGEAVVYQNGREVPAVWKKDDKKQSGKLFFYDKKGNEIKFVPGQIWIEIVEQNQAVSWK